jgi:hypothetical protein
MEDSRASECEGEVEREGEQHRGGCCGGVLQGAAVVVLGSSRPKGKKISEETEGYGREHEALNVLSFGPPWTHS